MNNFCLFLKEKQFTGNSRIFTKFSFLFFHFAETNVKKATTVPATAASTKVTNNSIKGTLKHSKWSGGVREITSLDEQGTGWSS